MDVEVSLYDPVHYRLSDVFETTFEGRQIFCGVIVASEKNYPELPLGAIMGITEYWPDFPIRIPPLQTTPVWLWKCELSDGQIVTADSMGKGTLESPSQWRL